MYAQVVLFGDSLTQQSFSVDGGGWGALLSDFFQRRADFLNRGFSGYVTDWARLILPRIVSKEAIPDLVVLFFGANDSALPELNPHQHVPLDRYKANLEAMCDYLQDIGLPKSSIILVAPPPVHEKMWLDNNQDKSWAASDRLNSVTRSYAEAVEKVGQEKNITSVGLYNELDQREDLQRCFSDGLHLSKDGNAVLASLLKPLLEERLAGKEVFPNWKEASVEMLQNC